MFVSQATQPTRVVEQVLTNVRLVLDDQVLLGSICWQNGKITQLAGQPSHLPYAQDGQGDWLLPGLIEMHTDNIEKHLQPRPKVFWPDTRAAYLSHDWQMAAAGVTTVFDALGLGEYSKASGRRELLALAVAAVSDAHNREHSRVQHLLHLRCELADEMVCDFFDQVVDNPWVRLVSLMDHTPGQRQWHDLEKYATFHRDKGWDAQQLADNVANRRQLQQRFSQDNRQYLVRQAQQRQLVLASHDDTLVEHVQQAHHEGASISEFPTTLIAAQEARRLGLANVMGAPNLLRGQSHSGNVSAIELAKAGLLDILSSDYAPAGLLQAVFRLHQLDLCSLPQAVALVSSKVANALALTDRGSLAVGLRADMVRVGKIQQTPVVRQVWSHGQQVI